MFLPNRGRMLYSIFVKVVRFLADTGLGLTRFPLVTRLYKFLYQALLPQERIILVPVQEHKMYVDIGDMGDLTPALVSSGIHDKQMTEVIKSIITRGMVCLDIGAMIGYFTLIMARLVGEEGKIFAFEPSPHNFDLLVKNIAINGYDNITAVPKAVSNKNEKTELFLDRINLGSHSLVTPGENTHTLGKDIIEVEAQTLDSLFRDYNGKIDFVKIDAGGAETAVLEGMETIINQNKDLMIITQFQPGPLATFGSSSEEFQNRLIQYGFKLYDIDEKKHSLHPIDAASLRKEYPPGKTTNLLAKQ